MSDKTLYIIAGPNGGGKSTFSKNIVPDNTIIFDGDLIFKEFSKYSTEDYLAWERVYEYFDEQIDEAILNNKNFAYETNFFQNNSFDIPLKFKKSGYNIILHFISLSTIELCLYRVAERVKLGGHSVPEQQIILRYNGGLNNLLKYYKDFNSLIIYSNDYNLKVLLNYENQSIQYLDIDELDSKSDISKIISKIIHF